MSNSQLQCPRELLLLVVRKFLANTNMAIELERRNLYAEEGPRQIHPAATTEVCCLFAAGCDESSVEVRLFDCFFFCGFVGLVSPSSNKSSGRS